MSGAARLRLAARGASVTIDVERGGRLASWSVDGLELLVGPPAPDDRSLAWGCFLMAPWAGRLAGGRFRASDGRVVQVPKTHGRNAIHGLLWDRPWTVESAMDDRAVLTCEIAQDRWPPGALVRHAVQLAEDRLELAATLTAAPAVPAAGRAPAASRSPSMAAAIGWHPWLRRGAESADLSLRVDASEVLETRRMIPTGKTAAVAGRTDLRPGPRLGRRRLDHAYVEARSPAVLRWPDLELEIAWDPSPSTLVVFTPPASVCVEPQTAWPNAPALEAEARSRSGLRMLAPGESLRATMSIKVRPRP